MRIPGADQAIGHLIKWSEKDEWAPYRRQVFAEHFEVIMERFDISEQEIVDLLDEAFGMVCGFVLEDFFTARFGEEGELNVVDDYLKRRGWREKVPAKRYLEALRDSVATLYEVVDLDPGHSMTVRDVILGGDPVSVEESSARNRRRVGTESPGVSSPSTGSGISPVPCFCFPTMWRTTFSRLLIGWPNGSRGNSAGMPRSKVSRRRSTTTACGNYCFPVRLPVAC